MTRLKTILTLTLCLVLYLAYLALLVIVLPLLIWIFSRSERVAVDCWVRHGDNLQRNK